jgi:3-deoxy-D-manno-octulosonic-acid transferase
MDCASRTRFLANPEIASATETIRHVRIAILQHHSSWTLPFGRTRYDSKPRTFHARIGCGFAPVLKIGLMRVLYTALMYLVTPIILYRLAFRGLRNRDYFWRWRERFGFFACPEMQDAIWVHAVSVGEFNAAVPLIEALIKRFPTRPMVVTTITPTGSARVQSVLGQRVFHVYLPYDLPGSVRRFLDRTKPKLAVVMETEIWPNLYLSCSARKIPILIANARLSERSLRGYGPAKALAGHCVRAAAWIAAQSKVDAERFLRLGAEPARLELVGNIKFDMKLPPGITEAGLHLRAVWGGDRPVWVAASTHEGEEAAVLEAHALVLRHLPDAMLIFVPRHPERFKLVSTHCRSIGFRTATRSENHTPDGNTQCFVLDSMGELLNFFAAADVAFVGGSLCDIGGHNMLEPAGLGIPVIVGPHTYNFEEIADRMILDGAAVRVSNGTELGQALCRILRFSATRAQMGEAGLQVVASERGALERLLGRAVALLGA